MDHDLRPHAPKSQDTDARSHDAQPPEAANSACQSGTDLAASEEDSELRTAIIDALKQCYDPEIPVDIYELGLIYAVDLDDANFAMIRMTLTSPMCPVAESLPAEVAERVREVPGVSGADIDLVWEPSWNPSMMSEAAKLQLGF